MKPIVIILGLAALAFAQDTGDRVTVPLTDPSRPAKIFATMLNGGITVTGYAGKDIVIESSAHGEHHRAPRAAEGMHRIDAGIGGFSADEDNNVVHIKTPLAGGEMRLQVPFNTSLSLKTMNGGAIKIDHVAGDLDLENMNGEIVATDVSGSVLANSMNGKVLVTFDHIATDKPMAFTTMNGDVDVTLPADARATLRMKSDNGQIYTDFDVKINSNANPPQVEDGRAHGGRYRVKIDRTTVGTINGGGPNMKFQTFNGNIYVRKKK
jgi:Toastrack DUF4097